MGSGKCSCVEAEAKYYLVTCDVDRLPFTSRSYLLNKLYALISDLMHSPILEYLTVRNRYFCMWPCAVFVNIKEGFVLVINQFDAQTFCFTMSLFHAFTCFEHHVLIIRRSKLYYTPSGIITPVDGCPVHGTSTYRCNEPETV